MKVLRIIARLNVGGPARHVALLNAGLDRRGHQTLLVHGELDEGESSLEHVAQAAGVRTLKLPHLGRRISPLGDIRAFAAIVAVIRRERPDVVHTHTAKAGTLGRLATWLVNATRRRGQRSLIVHTYHGHVFTGYFSPLGSAAVRFIERCLASVTHIVITISPAQYADVVERFRIAPAHKTTTVALGLNLTPLLALTSGTRDLRRDLGFAPSDLIVGCIGRMVPIKDLPTLVHGVAKAAERLPHLRLLFAGDGPERPALMKLVEELGVGDRVRLLGWTDDLPGLYATIDVCALTSINEGTPVALIEAMAAGKPVIATAVGGVPDVVEHAVTGLLIQPGRADELADAIVRLAGSPETRLQMGTEGRKRTERFAPERLVLEIERLYTDGRSGFRAGQAG